MKAIEILLHLSFLATATAQSTKSQHEAQYNAVCPSKVAEEEISPGLTVKYTCNFLGSYDKNSMFPSTLKECVERCQTTTGCTGSSWDKSSGYCALSGPTASKAHAGSILIEEVSPFPDDEEDEDPFPQSCEEEKDECDASLAQCEASLAAAQLAGVGNGAGAGAGSGTGDGTVPDIELYAKSCPKEGKIVTVAGRQWQARCARYQSKTHTRIGPILPEMNSKFCMEHCAATKDCTLAVIDVVSRCYIYSGGQSDDLTYSISYVSWVLL